MRALELSAALGYPIDISSATDKINDLSFTTVIGLIKWGAGLQEVASIRKSKVKTKKAVDSVRNFLHSLVP